MDGWMDGSTNYQMNGWMPDKNGQIYWQIGWSNRQIDTLTHTQIKMIFFNHLVTF